METPVGLMSRISVADICRWDPCPRYRWIADHTRPHERVPDAAFIRRCLGDRDSVSVVDDVLGLNIPLADRIWLLTRPGVLSEHTLNLGAWVAVCTAVTTTEARHTSDSLRDTWFALPFGRAVGVAECTRLRELYAALGTRIGWGDILIGKHWPSLISQPYLGGGSWRPFGPAHYSVLTDASYLGDSELVAQGLQRVLKGGFGDAGLDGCGGLYWRA